MKNLREFLVFLCQRQKGVATTDITIQSNASMGRRGGNIAIKCLYGFLFLGMTWMAGCQSVPEPILPIAQLDRGVQIVLPDTVLFSSGDDSFNQEVASPYLNRLARLLKEKTDKKISIEGHTDNVGSLTYNQNLSERRAIAVKSALLERGVPEDRMTTLGYAYNKPVTSNDTDAGKRMNRRSEIIVIGEKVEVITSGEPSNSFEVAFASLKNAIDGN